MGKLYEEITNAIKVIVIPAYNYELSSPESYFFVWNYNITIENDGDEKVQLLSRFWQIISSDGKIKEVQGEGVVGQQPFLEPGEKFHYTSAADLATPTGIMRGKYKMISAKGAIFEINIPAFSLDKPGKNKILH